LAYDILDKGSQGENGPAFDLTYSSAYEPGSPELEKDKLQSWELVKANEKYIEVQLTFVDPIYVATAEGFSRIIVSFGDGKQYQSIRYGTHLEDNKVNKIILLR
jgi:hypothetical protein